MCEARVYLEEDGEAKEIMENVISVKPNGDELVLSDIFGEKKTVKATLKEVQLLDHKILIESR